MIKKTFSHPNKTTTKTIPLKEIERKKKLNFQKNKKPKTALKRTNKQIVKSKNHRIMKLFFVSPKHFVSNSCI